MKLFHYGKDGGPDSTVWGFWLIEIKSLFSVALLCFENGSREAYHSHAFNSISWLLSGRLVENVIYKTSRTHWEAFSIDHSPSLEPILTSRDRIHKVESVGRSWVLTLRGPWHKYWTEYIPVDDKLVTLTNGRKIVDERPAN